MRTIRRRNRAAFSLLELIVVFSLVAIVTGVIGTHIYEGGHRKRFQIDVKTLQSQLALAKELACITKNEVRLVIEQKNGQEGGWFFYLEGDGLSEKLKRKFALSRKLASVKGVTVEGMDMREGHVIRLPFFTSGPQHKEIRLHIAGYYDSKAIELDDYSTPREGSDDESKALYPEYYEKETIFSR